MLLSDRTKTVLSILLVLILIMLFVMIAEGVIRTRQYIKYGTFTVVNDTHVDAATGLHIPVPGMQTRTISINSLGFRGPEIEIPKPAARFRLGFVGASTTYCAEVGGDEQVWTHLVTDRLRKQFPGISFDYVNGGISGYSSVQSLVNLEKRILPLQPDIVLIYHATNDLSAETRHLAEVAGIGETNLASKESWLSRYSLLWHLVEKNLALMSIQQIDQSQILTLDSGSLGNHFRANLKRLVEVARDGGSRLVALITFSIHLRENMSPEQEKAALVSARYYMPYMSADNLLAGFDHYNGIIREVAADTGALLVEQEMSIPGDPVHFNDSVHFTDAGSLKQAERISAALAASPELKALIKGEFTR